MVKEIDMTGGTESIMAKQLTYVESVVKQIKKRQPSFSVKRTYRE